MDTSGQEKFNNIISSYYRNIAAIIVFDLTDIISFNNVKMDRRIINTW